MEMALKTIHQAGAFLSLFHLVTIVLKVLCCLSFRKHFCDLPWWELCMILAAV